MKEVLEEVMKEEQDCFAYKAKKCSALKKKKCVGCSFYKTKSEFENDQKKAMKRIRSLDKEQQHHISETYYKGKMGGK